MAEILKLGGGLDDKNYGSDQVMGLEGGHDYKDTSPANSSIYHAYKDCEIVKIPESELFSGYNDNANDTMKGFVSIMAATNIHGYDPSCLTYFIPIL